MHKRGTMPAIESKMQTTETNVKIQNRTVVKYKEGIQGLNQGNYKEKTTCARKCLPCSTHGFELSGDESIAIVLNGNVNTLMGDATYDEYQVHTADTSNFCRNNLGNDLERSSLRSCSGVNNGYDRNLSSMSLPEGDCNVKSHPVRPAGKRAAACCRN